MSNIAINSSIRRFSDFLVVYLILLQSLPFSIHGSSPTATIMHVTCGTDIELVCPVSSVKRADEVISWFRPNSSHNHLKFIAIGDILFPEYATIGRFNLISSSTGSRLLISHVSTDDHGFYTCKSSSSGQHSIKLLVHSRPFLSPSSPLLLYPVNRTFSITCSLLCDFKQVSLNDMHWFVNGDLLPGDKNDYRLETLSTHSQRLTVYLNKKHRDFMQANYTCEYDGKEAMILVRRRTTDELHRLPRQQGSSTAYLLQTVFDAGQRQGQSTAPPIVLALLLLLLWFY